VVPRLQERDRALRIDQRFFVHLLVAGEQNGRRAVVDPQQDGALVPIGGALRKPGGRGDRGQVDVTAVGER